MQFLIGFATLLLILGLGLGEVVYDGKLPIDELHVLDTHILDIPNPLRQGSPRLKLSLTRANITRVYRSPAATNLLQIFFEEPAGEKHRMSAFVNTYMNPPKWNYFHFYYPGRDQEVCLSVGTSSWYSTNLERNQHFPLDLGSVPNTTVPYITGTGNSHFGPVLDHHLFNTDGFGFVFHEHESPLYFRSKVENGEPWLCLSIKSTTDPIFTPPEWQFYLYTASNVKEVRSRTAKDFISKNFKGEVPDARMFSLPVWRFDERANQAQILEFAKKVHDGQLTKRAQLVLTNWEAHIGDLTFDQARFPNPHQLLTDLHNLGFLVKVTIRPFISKASSLFPANQKYVIETRDPKNSSIQIPLMVNLNKEEVAVWNFQSKQTQTFLIDSLKNLKNQTGVDSFEFAQGQLDQFQGSGIASHLHPVNDFTRDYVLYMFRAFGSFVQMDSGFETQSAISFIRLPDLEPSWAGLQTLIPSALTLALAGYEFILPGTLGSSKISEELYIRWIQATTFLPGIQFAGLPPNDLSLNLTRKFLELHEEHSPTIIIEAQKSVKSQIPLLQPLWYQAPEDPKAWKVRDQFLVGEDLLIAPVVIEGQRERIVYLPEGNWVDQKGQTHKGPGEVKVQVPLEELAYFERKV